MNINKLIHKHYVSIFFFIILLVLALSLLIHPDSSRAGEDRTAGSDRAVSMSGLMSAMKMFPLSPPETAPDFTLTSLDGSKIRLSELRGNVVLLSFWATW